MAGAKPRFGDRYQDYGKRLHVSLGLTARHIIGSLFFFDPLISFDFYVPMYDGNVHLNRSEEVQLDGIGNT